jgi:hypothetical protein
MPMDLLRERSPKEAWPFLESMAQELAAAGAKLTLCAERQIAGRDGMGCAGFFESDPPELAFAVGKPFADWFLVAVHEFCHFKQWREEPESFNRACHDIERLFSWVAGEIELDEAQAAELGRVARDLEHDCERRVLANLGAFGIETLIDRAQYAQKANSYFNFYNYVARHRAWYEGGREPYTLPEVWKRFPEALLLEDGLTPEREALFALCAPTAEATAEAASATTAATAAPATATGASESREAELGGAR